MLPAACHVTATTELSGAGSVDRRPRAGATAVAGAPELAFVDGALQLREPLTCAVDEIARTTRTRETVVRPNLATFVIGAIATALGGIAVVRGATDSEPADSPLLYAGLAGAAIGAPLAIGPWLGNRTELTALPPRETTRTAPAAPCGARPLAVAAATLATGGLAVHAAVDARGALAVSPFAFVDAFAPPREAVAVTAVVELPTGPQPLVASLAPAALAAAAPGFLARLGIDPRIEPLRLVPGLVAGAPRAWLADGAVHLALPLRNDGPGPAWAVRAVVVAPRQRALDGRIAYVGALARGATAIAEIEIPVDVATWRALRGSVLDASFELRDAHGTAPTTPIRVRATLGPP